MKANNPPQGAVLFVGHGNPMNAIGENIARPKTRLRRGTRIANWEVCR